MCVCVQGALIFQKSRTLLKILAAEEWHEVSSLLGTTAPGFVHASICICRLITNESIIQKNKINNSNNNSYVEVEICAVGSRNSRNSVLNGARGHLCAMSTGNQKEIMWNF